LVSLTGPAGAVSVVIGEIAVPPLGVSENMAVDTAEGAAVADLTLGKAFSSRGDPTRGDGPVCVCVCVSCVWRVCMCV
jgi:hypothetical protein